MIDVATFQLLIHAGAVPVLAAACSYVIAGNVHFLGNRIWTFKAFHRSAVTQLRSYLVVVGTAWAVTIFIVGWLTGTWHVMPLLAKFAAVAITLPIGFFGHKYLTYGSGLRAAARTLYQHGVAVARD